nr:MAG TPA: hypothetical protein [Caudoviricetes sp.]
MPIGTIRTGEEPAVQQICMHAANHLNPRKVTPACL